MALAGAELIASPIRGFPYEAVVVGGGGGAELSRHTQRLEQGWSMVFFLHAIVAGSGLGVLSHSGIPSGMRRGGAWWLPPRSDFVSIF